MSSSFTGDQSYILSRQATDLNARKYKVEIIQELEGETVENIFVLIISRESGRVLNLLWYVDSKFKDSCNTYKSSP